jgi:hypothetical protein
MRVIRAVDKSRAIQFGNDIIKAAIVEAANFLVREGAKGLSIKLLMEQAGLELEEARTLASAIEDALSGRFQDYQASSEAMERLACGHQQR